MNIALKTHKLIGCKGVTRSDFKYYNNKFYLLETNTQPGTRQMYNFSPNLFNNDA